MAKKKKKLTVADANRTYFVVLANTRASMGSLAALALLTMGILGLVNFVFFNTSRFPGVGFIACVSGANLAMIWAGAVVLLSSMFRRLVYRFQVSFSIVMAVMAAMLVYSICLLALPFTVYVKALGEDAFVVSLSVAAIVATVLLVGSVLVHVLLLRRRLRVGHSESRTMGNFGAVSGSNRSKRYWIILAVVAIVPNVLTWGQYLSNTFAVAMLLLFVCVTPSLPVEFAYLAYLKSKDRVYWERRPRPSPRAERLRVAKKVGLWVFGIVAAWGVVWTSGKLL
ncbi:hypothetical protein [Leifsonia aquatica]|uniref:hypothetical protein n=1 Tax=Leifsonia aquatica TaxID=144185 RepID=UPI00381FFB21